MDELKQDPTRPETVLIPNTHEAAFLAAILAEVKEIRALVATLPAPVSITNNATKPEPVKRKRKEPI